MIFDQYQRYKTVEVITDIVRRRIQKKSLTILEIGTNEERNLGKVLPDDEIQFSDLTLTEAMKADKQFIQLNGCDMPEISDGQFDIVVALDVFEHVPDQQRECFIKEMNRVAKYAAIICFPYKNVYNESAEKRVNAYYKMIFGTDHKWLIEHIQNGLPQMDYVRDMLAHNEISYQEFYHGDIFLWEEMMKALFAVYGLQNGGYYFEEIGRMYEEQIYHKDSAEHSYRVFLVLSDDGDLLHDIGNTLKEKYKDKYSEKVKKLLLRCIDDIKYRLIDEQRAGTTVLHQVYYTFDGNFDESRKWILSSESLNANIIRVNQKIELDRQYKALRFDPIEGEACIVKSLAIESDTGEVTYEILNGTCDNDRIIFCDEDPQIYIDLEDKGAIKWIHVQAEILKADFPEAVIRYPFNQKIDDAVKKLIENLGRNDDHIAMVRELLAGHIQCQDEINEHLNKCNELLDTKMRQCEELHSQLGASAEREKNIRHEKEYWEGQCRQQEEQRRQCEEQCRQQEEQRRQQEEQCRQWEEQCRQQEEQCKYWETRCAKMEKTISWRITAILRKLGKLLQRKEG